MDRLFPLPVSLIDLRLARLEDGRWVVVVKGLEPGGRLELVQPESYRDLTFQEAVDVAAASLGGFVEAPRAEG